VRCAAQCVE